MKLIPHPYQRRAKQFMYDNPYAGLFLAPGLGKTSISMSVIKRLIATGDIKACLVIAPLRPCYLVWPKEKDKWDQFNNMTVRVLHGPDKGDELLKPADVYVINPEGLSWLFGALKGRRSWPFDMLIVDESTKFKHPDTKRFKILKAKLGKFKRRYILTGTPAANGLMDLFGQMYVMDEGNTLGKFITHYRKRYFYQAGFKGFEWKLQVGAEDLIHEAIAPRVIQMRAEDYLNLPELIINDVWVDLPPAAMVAYRKMEKILRSDFEAGRVTAANAAVCSSKCRQIASGGIYLDVGQEMHQIHYAKAQAVAEIVEELSGNPVLIAYEFRHDLVRLKETLGNVPHVGGKVTMSRTREIERGWNAGEYPILLGQPQTMATGLNLQESGSAIIWHTLTWNMENYDQFNRRVWRQGQKSKRVIVHRILARNTVDLVVASAISSKQLNQEALFDAITDYWIHS